MAASIAVTMRQIRKISEYCLAVWIVWTISVPEALAKDPLPHSPSASEIRRLPPFCAARYGGDKTAYQAWQQKFGSQNWDHMHHYCNALYFMNRARFETDKSVKKHYLNNVINELDYVLTRWSPSFQLSASARSIKLQAEFMQRS